MSNILVVLQQRDGQLHRTGWELLSAGRALAGATGGDVTVAVLGAGITELAAKVASRSGGANVLAVEGESLASYSPGSYVDALAPIVAELGPKYVLFAHSYQSMDYFPRLAQASGGAVVTNVSGFEGVGGEIHWRRPVLGGKLDAMTRVVKDVPVFVTVQAGTYAADESAEPGSVESRAAITGDRAATREILGVEQASEEEVDLSKASVIIAAGRGVGGEDKMHVIEALAGVLGAEIGASRPVIDNGWLPRDRQIGSSGQTVAPKLYVAAGVSGAIQHLVGMKGAGCVVAINKDPSAPIFGVSDYGIVGDLHEVVPALTAELEARKG